ncbi:MAG: flavodoxin domain-containing protein [Coriobacteriia bacterium]
MPDAISRREFVVAGAFLAAGVTVMATTGCSPTAQNIDYVETPSTHLEGELEMHGRVLVGYATRTGSTVGVAEAIGRGLADRGFEVDVKPLREHPSLAGYDAVVLGSAINGAAWVPEAMAFVKSNVPALNNMPVAAFCVHSMNGGTDAKQTKKRQAYLDQVRSLITLNDEGYFLGKGPDPKDTTLIARWAFRAFGGSGEGDMRDWDKIGAWAGEIHVDKEAAR